MFKKNLGRSASNPARYFVAIISGQGGIGKNLPSTEIRGHSKVVQLRLQLLQTKAIAAFPRCSRFAENIQRRRSHFRKFDKQDRSYQEKLHSLKARSDMPPGYCRFRG